MTDAHSGARIHAVILKVASRCNLNCGYCYMYQHEDQTWRDKPALLPERVWQAALLRMRAHCDVHGHDMALLLHGGEPTLIGPRRFERMVGEARDALGHRLRRVGVQTNATRIDRDWARLLARLGVDVSVSLDGPEDIHDAARPDHRGRGSYRATIRGLRALQAAGVAPYVLCVAEPGMDGMRVFRHFLDLGVRRFDFLLPDVSHDNAAARYGRHGPTPVADVLLPIAREWLRRDDPTIDIRVFSSLLAQIMGGATRTDMFGNAPLAYVVIDSDGAIQTLDALRVCAPDIGSSGLNVLRDGLDDLARGDPFVLQAVAGGVPLPAACGACGFARICGGGYLPHRFSRARGFDNPSVWCADIQRLLQTLTQEVDADAAA